MTECEPQIFETAEALSEKFEEAWDFLEANALNPLFHFRNRHLDEETFKSYKKIVRRICHLRCNERSTEDIHKDLYERLDLYVRMKCKSVLLPSISRKRNSPPSFIEKICNTFRTYELVIAYNFSQYFQYLHRSYISTHSNVKKVKHMMHQAFVDEVYTPMSFNLRRAAFSLLDFTRKGIRSDARYVRMYAVLIWGLSYKIDGFCEREWHQHLRSDAMRLLRQKENIFQKSCLCIYIHHVHQRTVEMREYVARERNVPLRLFLMEIAETRDRYFFRDDGEGFIHLLDNGCIHALRKMHESFQSDVPFVNRISNIMARYINEKIMPPYKRCMRSDFANLEAFRVLLLCFSKVYIIGHLGLGGPIQAHQLVETLYSPFKLLLEEERERALVEEHVMTLLDSVLTGSRGKKHQILRNLTVAEEVEVAVCFAGQLPSLESFLHAYRSRIVTIVLSEKFSPKGAWTILKPFMESYSDLDEFGRLKSFIETAMCWRRKKVFSSLPMKVFMGKANGKTSSDVVNGSRPIRKDDWPLDSSGTLRLPPDIISMAKEYEEAFHQENPEQDIEFKFGEDRLTVSTPMFCSKWHKRTEIQMTTYQMCILDLFQHAESYSVSRIFEKLGSSSLSSDSDGKYPIVSDCGQITRSESDMNLVVELGTSLQSDEDYETDSESDVARSSLFDKISKGFTEEYVDSDSESIVARKKLPSAPKSPSKSNEKELKQKTAVSGAYSCLGENDVDVSKENGEASRNSDDAEISEADLSRIRSSQNEVIRCLKSMTTKELPILEKHPDSSSFKSSDIISLNKRFVAPGKMIVLPSH